MLSITEILPEIKYKLSFLNNNSENENDENDIFLNSIVNVLRTSYIENGDIIFYSKKSFKKMSDFIFDYQNILILISSIIKQIHFLEKNNYSLIMLSCDDIYYINNCFVIINNKNLVKINKNKQITINFPIDKNEPFLSPEILNINEIPQKISHKQIYYNIGSLVFYSLFKKHIEHIFINDDIENYLKFIYNTNIYWFIIHSTKKDYNKRILFL